MDPYKDRNEQRLMIFTQLASTVVVLCGMVYEKVPGNLSNWIVTIIILVTLCPMLLVLLFFVFYPDGRDRRLLFKRWSNRMPACCSRRAQAAMGAWNDLQSVLRRIGQENEQVGKAVDAAIASIKDYDMEEDDAKDVMRLCGKIVAAASICNVETVQECTSELLGLFGVNSTQADAVVTSVGARLLIWCLKPKFEPQLHEQGLEWADVVPALETIDSVEELKDAVAEPEAVLKRLAEASVPLAKKLAYIYEEEEEEEEKKKEEEEEEEQEEQEQEQELVDLQPKHPAAVTSSQTADSIKDPESFLRELVKWKLVDNALQLEAEYEETTAFEREEAEKKEYNVVPAITLHGLTNSAML
jgi:chemotaxis protein histidine kinase CheA